MTIADFMIWMQDGGPEWHLDSNLEIHPLFTKLWKSIIINPSRLITVLDNHLISLENIKMIQIFKLCDILPNTQPPKEVCALKYTEQTLKFNVVFFFFSAICKLIVCHIARSTVSWTFVGLLWKSPDWSQSADEHHGSLSLLFAAPTASSQPSALHASIPALWFQRLTLPAPQISLGVLPGPSARRPQPLSPESEALELPAPSPSDSFELPF